MSNTNNWITVAESSFPWERDALEFVRGQFPSHEPYRAWSNFEFIADDGSINEVDLLVFSPQGLFLIEIKSRPGRLFGDAGTWMWETDGRLITIDNPLIAANTKAKKLHSLLQRQKACKNKGQLPFLEALVFCSAPDLRCELQRVGLSATVGNPQALVDWLAGPCQGERTIFLPTENQDSHADVKLDYVGSLKNAAMVISRLHRGEKRLVFVDSRSRAEQLAAELRQLDVTIFVTHSSLSQEQRHQAEEAFASREDCVIVATSVLELGIDIGDLDRVIQIDSPPTVSSFLQRMGRTGRRARMTRNCLFLATRDETLVQAAGLIDLWASGYIEPVIPPPDPYHILAQQLMALALQENGIGQRDWLDWIKKVPTFADMPAGQIDSLVTWMLQKEILWEDQGILWLGRKGEAAYGRRHFLELFSVFTSPPLFSVRHGSQELGFVDEMTFLGKQEDPRILLLGGRSWRVHYIDWQRRIAYVEATEVQGRSRWKGEGQALGFRLCQAIRNVLGADDHREWWSHRARQQIAEVRQEFAWLDDAATAVVRSESGEAVWWTFAGVKANATLACELSRTVKNRVTYDSFTLTFEPHLSFDVIGQALAELQARDISKMRPAVEEQAIDGLKFSQCLPHDLAAHVLEARLRDPAAVESMLHRPRRFVMDY